MSEVGTSEVVLLTGATGYLGRHLLTALSDRGLTVVRAGRRDCDVELDLARPETFASALAAAAPDYLLNAAAISSMAACQEEPALAMQVNGRGPQALSAAVAASATSAIAGSCRFLQVSTDLVFAGDAAPYTAAAPARPLSVYGMTKAEGERITGADRLVVRVPLLFGASFDGRSGATDMLRNAVGAKERLVLFTDEYRTPLHVADAARGLVDLLLDREAHGIRHLGGHERVSRWQFGERFARIAGLPSGAFVPGRSEDPRRPKDVSLVSDRDPGRSLDAALRDS